MKNYELQGTNYTPDAIDYEIFEIALESCSEEEKKGNLITMEDVESYMYAIGKVRGYAENWMEKLSVCEKN